MSRRTLSVTATVAVLFSVIGCGLAVDDREPKAESAETVIRIEVTETGFTPSNVKLAPGVPAVLEFVRTAEKTCATAVVFPESGIRHELPLNESVRLTVRPQPGQQVHFACPMDMYAGVIEVTGGDE